MLAILIIAVAGVILPATLVGLVGLYLKVTDNAADEQSDSDRAASFAEFSILHVEDTAR